MVVASWYMASASATSTGMSMTTGPGRPVEAMWKASCTMRGRSAVSLTRYECLTIGSVMPVMSASWKASVPMRSLRTCQVMATSGDESR